jgi:hypothetical protein
MSALIDILSEIERRGIVVRVEGENLRLSPRCALDDKLLKTIAELKPEIIREAARSTSTTRRGSWSAESLEAERRFHGQPHAKLFPFIGRKVRTPKGVGTLVQVFAERVTVLLDRQQTQCAVFEPGEIEPVSWDLP